MKNIIGDYKAFVDKVNTGLERAGIDRFEIAMIDHLCYRVENEERYRQLLHEFGKIAVMIDETKVSGRPIATFEFDNPLAAGGWMIPYLELPAPKEGSPYSEDLEHCELVIVGSLEKFIKRHTNLPFDHKGINKPINPELSLKTDFMSVKFHEQSLGAVVRIEQHLEARSKQGT